MLVSVIQSESWRPYWSGWSTRPVYLHHDLVINPIISIHVIEVKLSQDMGLDKKPRVSRGHAMQSPEPESESNEHHPPCKITTHEDWLHRAQTFPPYGYQPDYTQRIHP